MDNPDSYIDFSTLRLDFDEKMPLSYYWKTPSLVEVVGTKGSGKTALALRLGLDYAQLHPHQIIKIINCGGGITWNRLKCFLNYEYFDIFSVEDLQQMLIGMRNDKRAGLVILDSVANLILGAPTQRNGLGDWLSALRELGWSIIFTNLIQGKL